MGDDWFHYGAFRQMMLGYVHMQTGQRGEGTIAPSEIYDQVRGVLACRLGQRFRRQQWFG